MSCAVGRGTGAAGGAFAEFVLWERFHAGAWVAVVMIFEVSICWCSTAVTAVGCSDALEPGGSRGVVFLPLWAVLVGYHSLSAEGVGVRWGSLKG